MQENEAAGNSQGKTILLVEDEASVRNLFAQVLKMRGYAVLQAADGEEAVRVFHELPAPVDLVITDVVMPRMNGRELATRLRREHPNLRVILMSGYTDEIMIRSGAEAAGMIFLQKPLRADALLAAVRASLDASSAPFSAG